MIEWYEWLIIVAIATIAGLLSATWQLYRFVKSYMEEPEVEETVTASVE